MRYTKRRLNHIPPHLRTGSEEQAAVLKVLKSTGWEAYSISDPRVRRQTKGLPDVVAFRPGAVLFWETKTGSGELTDEQAEFGRHATRAGAYFGWGDAAQLTRFLGLGLSGESGRS